MEGEEVCLVYVACVACGGGGRDSSGVYIFMIVSQESGAGMMGEEVEDMRCRSSVEFRRTDQVHDFVGDMIA